MKRTGLVFILALASVNVWAQEATITTPVVRASEAKLKVLTLNVTQIQAVITVSVQDSTNIEIRTQDYTIPDGVHTGTVGGLFTALDTVRASETGGVLRRTNFRILGYLLDNGYLPGTTLVP